MTNIDPKAKVILFLGAGASAALEIPTSKSFPKIMETEYKWNTELLSTICVDYLRYKGIGEYSPDQIDAEDMRDYLVDMERVTEPLAKLKSESIPPISKFGGDAAGAFTFVRLARQKFDDEIRQTYKGVSTKAAYQHYNTLFQRLWGYGLNILPIFTTNYDLVLENYAEYPHNSLTFIDGFFRSQSGAGDLRLDTSRFRASTSTSNTILFFKLHGSTNWFKHKEEQNKVIRLPFGTQPQPEYDYLLIYPTKVKRETITDYPFKDLYTYLKEYLESGSIRLCIVIGYSFGDLAINDLFKIAVERGMRLLIIDPDPNVFSLSDKIKLQSRQYTMCKSQFSNKYWDSHIKIALDKELNILPH